MQLIIPDKLMVGFQKRHGTYSGKLAYVTYVDHKGKHRSEHSWNGWRDHKIPHEELVNEPTAGFVLNKKAGGYASGWNHRQTYSRVYDPRGFEFEIDIPNLLFILEHCSCIKGKGLEGEFVYAWGGRDLILLPADCPDYKESRSYTDLQDKKVTRKDMAQGCLYQTKDTQTVMYLGRHEIAEYDWYDNVTIRKRHVFEYMPDQGSSGYWFQNGYTKLATRLTEQPHAEFANFYDKLMQGKHVSHACDIKVNPYDPGRHNNWMDGLYNAKFFYRDDEGGIHYIKWEYDRWSHRDRDRKWRHIGQLVFDGAKHKLDTSKKPKFIFGLDGQPLKDQQAALKARLVTIELVNKHGEKCYDFKFRG